MLIAEQDPDRFDAGHITAGAYEPSIGVLGCILFSSLLQNTTPVMAALDLFHAIRS